MFSAKLHVTNKNTGKQKLKLLNEFQPPVFSTKSNPKNDETLSVRLKLPSKLFELDCFWILTADTPDNCCRFVGNFLDITSNIFNYRINPFFHCLFYYILTPSKCSSNYDNHQADYLSVGLWKQTIRDECQNTLEQ